MPDGEARGFHIGPHAPTLQADDVQLVHRLWLSFRRDPDMQNLHHSDIVTYALTRLASESYRDRHETLKGLKSRVRGTADPQSLSDNRTLSVEEDEDVGFAAGGFGPPT
jgi:hypothetical protein